MVLQIKFCHRPACNTRVDYVYTLELQNKMRFNTQVKQIIYMSHADANTLYSTTGFSNHNAANMVVTNSRPRIVQRSDNEM